jgi:MFS family permease
MLVIKFLIGITVGSPFQGHMSDKSSRKKLLIVTVLSVILSLLTMVIGQSFCPHEYFPILLSIACISNGVFGNVCPVAAAYSEQKNDFQRVLRLSLICRYGALATSFLLRLPTYYGFLTALAINQISFFLISFRYKEKSLTPENQ